MAAILAGAGQEFNSLPIAGQNILMTPANMDCPVTPRSRFLIYHHGISLSGLFTDSANIHNLALKTFCKNDYSRNDYD